jgi:hypothetical protein
MHEHPGLITGLILPIKGYTKIPELIKSVRPKQSRLIKTRKKIGIPFFKTNMQER